MNPNISANSNGKTMILSNCAICGGKKSKFIKKQEANCNGIAFEKKAK